MPINKYLDRLYHLDFLIRHKSTGVPKELAQKMGLSESIVYRYLNAMKGLGAPIRWCRHARSYVYDWEGTLEVRFMPDESNASRK